MDQHHRIAAILNIVSGALALATIACFALFFGTVAAFIPDLPIPTDWIVGFGAAFAGLLGIVSLGQVIAGTCLLAGRPAARAWLIAFGILELPAFPIGTALGVYTIWALLRDLPQYHDGSPRVTTR